MAIASLGIKTRRGAKSWSYLVRTVAILLPLEAASIFASPLNFAEKMATCFLVLSATAWLLLNNGWVQNKVVGIISKAEARWR